MAGYFGTDDQKRWQKWAYESLDEVERTPGLCSQGRMLGTDDPSALEPGFIERKLDEYGIFGFRLVTRDALERYVRPLEAKGYRVDTWNVLMGDAADVLPRVRAIVETGPGEGLAEGEPLTDPEDARTLRVQTFMAAQGVAPFPGAMLVDGPKRITVTLVDADGALAAAAHAYMGHNSFSPFRSAGWVGMVAVDPSRRGTGLGRYANARAALAALERMGADRVYELVGETNVASRRMVEACGLSLRPDLVSGFINRAGAARVTR
jgi:GNAT superfamily N-acetyltransferase